MTNAALPRILIIDDLFGRTHPDRPNADRASLCAQYLLEDITGDQPHESRLRVKQPVARAYFCRGQKPRCSVVGDIVENDVTVAMEAVGRGWFNGGWFDRGGVQPWALVLLDLSFYTGRVTPQSDAAAAGMPEGRPGDDSPSQYFGLRLLSELSERFPDLPIVILSSQSRDDVSREFAARGALAFLPRADENSPQLLREYIERHGLVGDDHGEIVGMSKSLLLALRAARQAGMLRRNVLIRGERGTGKELMARYIHRHSLSGQSRPYVVVDSGALSPQLYGSELFGHRRGAFTGADREREGRILQADGGDLFLDEIGNMPADVQVGLLRVLEQREVVPLGAQHGQKVDVRFLSATNENIESAAQGGAFRADLLDRLREGGAIHVPPLRARTADLPLVVERLVRQAEGAYPGTLTRSIEPETLEFLARYLWPGNIRELRSAIFGAVSRYPEVEHLFPIHFEIESSAQPAALPQPAASVTSRLPLTDLLAALEQAASTTIDGQSIVGALPIIQRSAARLQAGLLRSALIATRRPTPDHPDGQLLIHPAVKLLTGNRTISASRAADMVKRIFSYCPEIRDALLEDPILRKAHDIAHRLRPARSKGSGNASVVQDQGT
jgi:DNA-binding NtrC family response regulator